MIKQQKALANYHSKRGQRKTNNSYLTPKQLLTAAKVQIKSDKTKTIINYLNFVDYENFEII